VAGRAYGPLAATAREAGISSCGPSQPALGRVTPQGESTLIGSSNRIVGYTGKFCSDATWSNTHPISFGFREQVIELKQGGQGASDCLARLGRRMWTWAPTLPGGKQLDVLTTEATQALLEK
jgi:hypothetical protein